VLVVADRVDERGLAAVGRFLVIEDGNQAVGGTFANNFSNASGGDYTNVTSAGLGRRRLILGAKIIF